MTNSADPDQLASSDPDLHCLLRQGMTCLAREGLIFFSIFDSGGHLVHFSNFGTGL